MGWCWCVPFFSNPHIQENPATNDGLSSFSCHGAHSSLACFICDISVYFGQCTVCQVFFWKILINLVMISIHQKNHPERKCQWMNCHQTLKISQWYLSPLAWKQSLSDTDFSNKLTLTWIHYIGESYRRTNNQLCVSQSENI